MNITAAKTLRKNSRVCWFNEEEGLGPWLGSVSEKHTDSLTIVWDSSEEPDEFVSLASDDKYFLNFLEKVN